MSEPLIYSNTNKLAKSLKKSFKCYKNLIKENIRRSQRFPVIELKKSLELDNCCVYVHQNGFDESVDQKISRILKKNKNVNESNDYPPNKRQKLVKSTVNLFANEDLIEELDDLEDDKKKVAKTNDNHSRDNSKSKYEYSDTFTKIKGYSNNASDSQKKRLSVYETNPINSQSFKIPKNMGQNIESIIRHAKSLANSSVRCVDAFTYLVRNLSEDQWMRYDVKVLLPTIALTMSKNIDFLVNNIIIFNELIDKIKILQIIDEDFWDQLIYGIEKKTKNIYSHVRTITILMEIEF